MAKKIEKTEGVDDVVVKDEIVFVNPIKLARAKEIVALLARAPKTEDEQELKAKFANMLKEDEVATADSVEYVYVKLGGLVRTRVEQVKAEELSAKLKANKKVTSDDKSEKDSDEE
jgi:hypothetical protein